MEQYHGTNATVAIALTNGNISVDLGGGELGKGFYTGDLPHEAFNWAHHQYGRDKSVVKFVLADNDFLNLNPFCLDYFQTIRHRKEIRNSGQTRTFTFGENAIWAPVVGKKTNNFSQVKFETKTSENYLNGDGVFKLIV